MKKTLAATVAVSMLAFTAACGGGGGRPSTDEIADALKNDDQYDSETFSDEAVDCLAEKFHESDISDEALQALVDGDEDYDASDDDEAAAEAAAGEFAECVSS